VLRDVLLPELDGELATTRAVLARVREEHAAFQPHPRSWTLGELALHVASVPAWLPTTLRTRELELASFVPPRFTSAAAALRDFEQHAAAARAALSLASDAEFAQPWTLKRHGQALFTLPRSACIRTFVFSHLIHHRGQLTVYLRLCDVPLPPIYGPTADVSGEELARGAHTP
jgi:uncharacterized damage-inducible protein DinB